jgi:hypothetical protein
MNQISKAEYTSCGVRIIDPDSISRVILSNQFVFSWLRQRDFILDLLFVIEYQSVGHEFHVVASAATETGCSAMMFPALVQCAMSPVKLPVALP